MRDIDIALLSVRRHGILIATLTGFEMPFFNKRFSDVHDCTS